MTDAEAGPGGEKLWAGSLLRESVLEFLMRMEREKDKMHPYEILAFIQSIGVGTAELDALSRMVISWSSEPYYDFVRRASDGKLHRYRISWGLDNKAVRDLFARILTDEGLRKARLKSDPITSLAIALGRYRGKGAEGGKPAERPKTL